MTNAEVYIGDEDLIDTFIDEFSEFAYSEDVDFKYHYLKETLVRFFKAEAKIEKEEIDTSQFTDTKYEWGGVNTQ